MYPDSSSGREDFAMKLIKSIVKIAILVLGATSLHAQVMSPIPAGSQAAYFNIGLDPAVLITCGYTRGIGIVYRDAMVSAELAIPVAKFDLRDYRLKVGGQASLFQSKGWDVSAEASFILRGTENWMHSATNIGVDITALFGYYGKRWFAAGEFGLDKALATKIAATGRYKQFYYDDFKDGWYGNPGGNFHYGLRTGFLMSQTEITLRLGLQKTELFNEGFPPFFGVLGVNYRF